MVGHGSLSGLRMAIENAAQCDPDRVALTDGHETRTYGELARLAEVTDVHGEIGREVLVVGGSLRDVELILGKAFEGVSLLLLDSKSTAAEVERAEAIFVEGSGEGLDGVVLGLCTSGSSGLPKVVELDWEGVIYNAGAFGDAARYGEGDVVWCTTPLAHLYCLGAGVIGGLLHGATILLTLGMLDPEEFSRMATEQAPTFLLSIPFLFRRYLMMLIGEPGLAESWSVRSCIAAGEAVAPDLIAAWRKASGVSLLSHYGLTEGGQITLASGDGDDGVGRPLAGVEVQLRSDGAVRVRRPGAAAHRIIGRPADPEGWCETGDLGYLDEDGNLHITGRADRRINVAGKKVDPAEVEQVLASCEGVEDCAVARIEGSEGEQVVAFVQADGAAAADGAIRAQLAARLSPHKLPRRFVRVEEIPRTLTGKVRLGNLIADLESADAADAAEARESSVADSTLGRRLEGLPDGERD